MSRQSYDVGIRVPYLVSSFGTGGAAKVETRRDQFIGLRGSKIARICSFADYEAAGENEGIVRTWIRGDRHVALPGLVNAHTHLPMSLFRGLADDAPLHEWLHDHIFPLEASVSDAAFCEAGTDLSLLESIRYGTTTFCDSYFHESAIASCLDRAGVRGVLAETTLDFATPSNPKADDSVYAMIRELHGRYVGHPLLEIAVGAHAPYTCNDATLRKVDAFARELDLKTLIHVSETAREVRESFEIYGLSPIARLQKLGLLRSGLIIAHAVHLDSADRNLLAASGASVVYNPESNMKLGSGTAPIIDYLRRGIPVGLGTDGAASNNRLNLFSEMDSAAKLQKLMSGDNTAMTAANALWVATIGGARALGLDDRIGSLEEGKDADLILVDLDHPHLTPIHDVQSLLVYAANGSEVDVVLCAGKTLYERGEWKTLDRERVRNAVRKQVSRMPHAMTF